MKSITYRVAAFLLCIIIFAGVFPVVVAAADNEPAPITEDTVFHVRPVKDNGYVVSAEKYNAYESEHFQILWGNKNNSVITQKWLEGNAEILESCWKLFIEEMGMSPPSLCTRKSGDQKTHYKVNLIVMGTGIAGYESGWAYGGIDSEGYAYMMCDVNALTPSPQSWVTPHEFGHCVHFAQNYNSWGNSPYLGPWYEAIANWFREQYLYSDYYTSNQSYRTDLSPLYLRSISLTATNGRAYYEAWPIFQYLVENPDNLEGYGKDFVVKLLQNGTASGYIYKMIEDLAEAELSETLGYFAAHMATLDFKNQKNYLAKMRSLVTSGEFFWQQFYTLLEPVLGRENVYTVPTERAPQQAGYVITPLTITGDEITVTLNGLIKEDGAAWRACIVTVTDDSTNYSKLFGDGETMTVSTEGVKEAYLTVAATPDLSKYVKYTIPTWNDASSEESIPFDKKPRYPFEVTITGAEPSPRTIKRDSRGKPHPNGGGFVASTASVDKNAYVGPNAMVLGNAKVRGNVRIEGNAVVMGNAVVKGNVIVSGYAIVAGNAKVSDNAYIGDYAIVSGSAKISDNAKVIESAYVFGNYSMSDNSIAKGLALCLGSGSLSGQAVADGDFYDDSGAKINKGTVCGYLSSTNTAYIRKRPQEKGLYLGYTFDNDDGLLTKERFSSTYARVFGATWFSEGKNGAYSFDGESQYISLDASVLYTNNMQIKMNVLWNGGDASGNVFYFGGNGAYMYFTPSGEGGVAELVLSDGEKTQRIASNKAMPVGEWVEVIITLYDGVGALTIGDERVACSELSVSLADIRSKIGAFSAYYLGRGEADDSYFAGSLDYIKFYFENASAVDLTPMAAVDTSDETDTDTADASDESNGSEKNGNSTLVIILLATSIVALALVATALYMFVLRGKGKSNSNTNENSGKGGNNDKDAE